MDIVLLKRIRCKHCGGVFYVCRSCWRGQVYCGAKCREICMSEAHREAERRYRQTERGKETHRQGECRRRMKKNKKTVDDQGTTPEKSRDIEDPLPQADRPRCLFCGLRGVVVACFPRRGYGGGVFWENVGLARRGYC
jgi:hypothetical protein